MVFVIILLADANRFLLATKKGVKNDWIKVLSPAIGQNLDALVDRESLFVRSSGTERVKDICHRDDSPFKWNRFSRKA